MAMHKTDQVAPHSSEVELALREIQNETTLLALPGLCIAGFIIILCAKLFPDPLSGGLAGLILLLISVIIWGLRQSHYLLLAWTLVIGLLSAVLLPALWGEPAMMSLLALPVGLASLLIGVHAGILTTVVCTIFMRLLANNTAPMSTFAQAVVLAQMWGTVWLVWLTSRPLLTAMEWFQASHQQSRHWLEQARDYQLELSQTLQDLADANLQLTRLNRLAQAMRQRAEEARRAKEQFVANVSHELRTPLNMIIGFIEMMMQTPEVYGRNIPQSLLADLSVVLRNSRHLSSLVDDVLDLSQIEAGQMALVKEQVRLEEVIEAAITAVRPLFNSKGLYLKMDMSKNLALVFCDRTRIRQVVLNLLSNAGRFTEQGGVTVHTWQERMNIVVSVEDTGPGIATEALHKIFQPFQQLDDSIRRRHGGSGLGLSISRSFIELHKGQMWVESKERQGTTFFFCLPIDPAVSDEESVARWLTPDWEFKERTRRFMAPLPTDRPRLVVLERGNSLQRLLARYLADVEIAPVSSLEAAIQELLRIPAQALLINEPMVGERLQQLELAATLPYGTPAILCTIPGLQESAGALGASGYLVKPVARQALLTVIDCLSIKGKTILLVDDEPDALRLFQRMLVAAERGYRVLRATNGRQAIDLLRTQRPDLVILDLVMPEMDGFQLLAEKKQDPQLRDIPVIVVSARDPAGQPIVSQSLAVLRGGGISIHRLLATIEAMIKVLSPYALNLGIQSSQEDVTAQGLAKESSSTEG
jgi:signal transduction histidine kinase/CheY-like chemotaxis protein